MASRIQSPDCGRVLPVLLLVPGCTFHRTHSPGRHKNLSVTRPVWEYMVETRRVGMARTETRFDRIYEAHHHQILVYCLRRVSPEEADAAANEVFEVA